MKQLPEISKTATISRVRDAAKNGGYSIEIEQDRFVISIPSDDLFLPGDDQLSSPFLPFLAELAKELGTLDTRIEIQAHLDNIPSPSARFSSGWELSIAQAAAVYRYFIDLGIPAERLNFAGFAEHQPVRSNDSALGRAKNRRIELILKSAEVL